MPAALMSLAVPQAWPPALNEQPTLRMGALVVVGLLIGTIATAVAFHNFLYLPPMLGMMTGLGALGYLRVVSELIYTDLRPTKANMLVVFLAVVVDNIPVMFAVLAMNPDMSTGLWLLVTQTAGVSGSLLSIGSAAGASLM